MFLREFKTIVVYKAESSSSRVTVRPFLKQPPPRKKEGKKVERNWMERSKSARGNEEQVEKIR